MRSSKALSLPTLRILGVMATLVAYLVLGTAAAQIYPVKPIRIVVPFAPGGPNDILARVIGQKLAEVWGQQVIADNRPGGGTVIGTEIVTKSPPDGYTLLMVSTSHTSNPSLRKLPYDPIHGLEPVILVASGPNVVLAHPSLPAKSVKELIAIAKGKEAVLNAAINVPGSTSHLSAEMFRQLTGARVTPVPYKGGGLSMVALMSGEVDFQFAEGLLAAPQIRAGKIRALAVSTAKPSAAFPDLPTVNATLPGLVADNWFAMFFRTGTPRDIVAAINRGIGKTLESKPVRALFEQDALTAIGGTPEDLGAHMKSEMARYGEVIRKGNITVQ